MARFFGTECTHQTPRSRLFFYSMYFPRALGLPFPQVGTVDQVGGTGRMSQDLVFMTIMEFLYEWKEKARKTMA